MKWLKRKILKWLGLDYEIYAAVDWHIQSPSEIIIVKVNNDGTMEVIGDQRIKGKNYQEIFRQIQSVCRKYKRKIHIVHDLPYNF